MARALLKQVKVGWAFYVEDHEDLCGQGSIHLRRSFAHAGEDDATQRGLQLPAAPAPALRRTQCQSPKPVSASIRRIERLGLALTE